MAGLLKLNKKPGDKVSAGEQIGEILFVRKIWLKHRLSKRQSTASSTQLFPATSVGKEILSAKSFPKITWINFNIIDNPHPQPAQATLFDYPVSSFQQKYA